MASTLKTIWRNLTRRDEEQEQVFRSNLNDEARRNSLEYRRRLAEIRKVEQALELRKKQIQLKRISMDLDDEENDLLGEEEVEDVGNFEDRMLQQLLSVLQQPKAQVPEQVPEQDIVSEQVDRILSYIHTKYSTKDIAKFKALTEPERIAYILAREPLISEELAKRVCDRL